VSRLKFRLEIAGGRRLGSSAISTRKRPPAASKDKLHEFHIMRVTATPAKLIGIVRATDEKAALAQAIES
jgi:hypothetical protein